MPPTRNTGHARAASDQARVRSLFGLIDLVGRDTRPCDFLPRVAVPLRMLADFDLLGIVLPSDE